MALMAHYVFVMRLPDHRKLLDQSHQPIRPIANVRKTPLPWAVKSQNFSKSHVFQALKNGVKTWWQS